MKISEPFIVKKGNNERICLYDYENEDLLLLYPLQVYGFPGEVTQPVSPLEHSPFLIGDIIEIPEGKKQVTQIDVIPALDMNQLEEKLRNQLPKGYIGMSRLVRGYRYKLATN